MASGWSGRVRRTLSAAFGMALLLALASVPAGRSQSPFGNNGGQASGRASVTGRPDLDSPDDYDSILMERRLKALNIERQRQMVADVNKLLKLARELNDEVAAAGTDELTLDQEHKLAEIEKLAHSVKERMAEGVEQPAQSLMPAPLAYPIH